MAARFVLAARDIFEHREFGAGPCLLGRDRFVLGKAGSRRIPPIHRILVGQGAGDAS